MSDDLDSTDNTVGLSRTENPRDGNKEDMASYQSEPDIQTSQRLRVMTTKGREYQDNILRRNYDCSESLA